MGKESTGKDFPSVSLISRSGLKELKHPEIKFSIPLKTERMRMRAAVLIIIPTVDMMDIMLMILCFFFENKYLQAIKKAVLLLVLFKIYSFRSFSIFSM